jgi:tetratricopeptide (TPR) repeat protein
MKRTRYRCSVCVAGILLACSPPAVWGSDRAGDLIQEAHQHDGLYNLGPQVSPDRAISLYHQALQVGPDDRQRLHILSRLARLYTYSERPDRHATAMALNEQILKEFSTDELAVLSAMSSLAQNCRALGQNTKALEWAKRMINYNDDPNRTARSRSAPGPGDTPQDYPSRKRAQQIRQYKEVAVGMVAFLGDRVDPLIAEAELRHIVAEHPGTYLAEKAQRLLGEIARELSVMARMEDLVNAPGEGIPADPLGTTLQTGAGAALVTTDHNASGQAHARAHREPIRRTQGCPTTGDVTAPAPAHDGSTRTSRGPPLLYLAAGLALAGAVASFGVYALKGMKVTKSREV